VFADPRTGIMIYWRSRTQMGRALIMMNVKYDSKSEKMISSNL
jgi:hypothetical protein